MSTEHKETATKAPLKRDDAAKKIKYMRDKDREMVKGIFKFYEVPGGCMKFSYKAYKEDPVEDFELYDGQVYTIPLGVAKHLNKNGWYPIHAYAQNEQGRPVARIGQKVHRFGFHSIEFTDIEDLNANKHNEIVTVERV
jgi:hypothetical protein